ncbi:efflux RND transporter permease subunit [Solirhodobacter olei]|uniref:efflux RND transporter permease subunit n=1 Tax=Solirhodobacter olei TaxID=2493082 RepID=UPI000FDC14AA|nr:efflux RND transporter permease subunit [Solirhodobacter olei]
MSISAFFIRRPVATILMMIGIIFAGYAGYTNLPVAALPQADLPTIQVSADLAGASPDTMATSVATPLIKQFETIEGIDSISATSTLGSTDITIQFALSRNIDAAAADVQAAISRASRKLPSNMTQTPSYRKVNPASAPIIMLALTSDAAPLTQVDDIAENVISPMLSTLPGVAQALVFGSRTYAVRVDVSPKKLHARNLSMNDVASALKAANDQTPVGEIQNSSQQLTISADTQRTSAAAFRTLIIAKPDGNFVRLGDVANVYDSVNSLNSGARFDGQRGIILAVQRQPDANTVAVVDAIRAKLPEIRAALPAGTTIRVVNDAAAPIKAAVHDVQGTLAITIGLVVLVIYIFLNRLTATMIPAIAVPLSLIATLGLMYFLGYSIDNISLMGMTLSVGLVVDDAIVMLENIVRRTELGEPPMHAALEGSREVTSTIISMSLSLVAVFLPILLMGGVVGRILNEFGVVVTIAILSSAVVSLTATPMMAARLPVVHHAGAAKRTLSHRITDGYERSVAWCLRHQGMILMLFFATAVSSFYLFTTIQRSFFPPEDLGTLIVSTTARQDISYAAMEKLQGEAAAAVKKNPAVAHVASVIRSSQTNRGFMYVQLKDKKTRPPIQVTLGQLRRTLGGIPGIRAFVSPTQSIRFGGRATDSTYQIVLQSIDASVGRLWAQKLEDAMRSDPAHFVDVASDYEDNALQAKVVVDQNAASRLGVTAQSLRTTLEAGFGSDVATQIQTTGSSYDVILEYNPNFQWTESSLQSLMIPTSSGKLVPLASFAKVVRSAGPVSVNQTGQLTAVTLSFNLPAGVSLGTATERISQLKAQMGMPATVLTSYAGAAKLFQQASGNTGLLIGAAVLTIYIVLGVLYESFIHPITILSGLPSAALGSLLALQVTGFDLSIIALIGLLMLIGIVKKNAIMMIDVALVLRREEAMSAVDAIRIAAARRFRPIMMTTFCAMLGVLPIALGTGASSELRQPLGVAVVGGLLVSQALTLYITPVIFVQMEKLSGFTLRLVKGGWRKRQRKGGEGANQPVVAE